MRVGDALPLDSSAIAQVLRAFALAEPSWLVARTVMLQDAAASRSSHSDFATVTTPVDG